MLLAWILNRQRLSLVALHDQGSENRTLMFVLYPRGVLASKSLLGMCRWMGSHFHNWTDYNRVTFLVELLEWGRTFSGFLV